MRGIEVHFLGVGTCALAKGAATASYALNLSGETVALELGNGAELRLFEAGYDYKDLKYVLISHAHPDHVSDLLMLLQSMLYTPGFERTEPLTVIAPAMVFKYLDLLQEFYAGAFEPQTFELVRVVLSDGDSYTTDKFSIKAMRMEHFIDSLGYRIESGEAVLAYTGDTDFHEGLFELFADADAVIADTSFLHSQKLTRGHMSVREAAIAAAKAGAKRLVLSHRNPIYTYQEALAEARDAGFTGEVLFPYDGDKLLLSEDNEE